MKKKTIKYSDLSKKQLQDLKELYIKKKVASMSHKELTEFVLEIISNQINDTIGQEEEMEAWEEMSIFYGDQFESVVNEIQEKYAKEENLKPFEEDTQEHRLGLLEKNSMVKEHYDMWDD